MVKYFQDWEIEQALNSTDPHGHLMRAAFNSQRGWCMPGYRISTDGKHVNVWFGDDYEREPDERYTINSIVRTVLAEQQQPPLFRLTPAAPDAEQHGAGELR